MSMPMYQWLAQQLHAYTRIVNEKGPGDKTAAENYIKHAVDRHFPHGGGFDCGITIAPDVLVSAHHDEAAFCGKLIFRADYHHMNDAGYYDGWTQHAVTVTPCLVDGYKLQISGRNRNSIKNYITEVFDEALRAEVELIHPEDADGKSLAMEHWYYASNERKIADFLYLLSDQL